MIKKIVIAGGSGFIGKYVSAKFKGLGYDVVTISRHRPAVTWDNQTEIIAALEDSTMLINLAGKSVDCRYNEKNKAEILRSRTETTTALGEAILKCKNPPALWINSGTATIYRHAEDRPMTEDKGEIGSGFSVHVATSWEKAFFDFKLPQTRQVVLRIAIVLGDTGGALKPLINLVRFGLGGPQGKGTQMFSWIHIEDLFNIISFIQTQPELNGVFNCSSPNPVTNKVLMKTLREVMQVKIGMPSPAWLLKIGAMMISTEPELVLKSRWVVPEKLLNAGYAFKYATLAEGLSNLVDKK